jgi:hypothetical protein
MRTVHSRQALASLKERYYELVFGTVVRASIAYAESTERARSILDHRPDLGADYLALANEVLERLPGLRDARIVGDHSDASGSGESASAGVAGGRLPARSRGTGATQYAQGREQLVAP